MASRLRVLRRVSAGLACTLLAACGIVSAQAADLPRPWVEFGADGGLSIRVPVPPGAPCPLVTANDRVISASPRAVPDERFPLQVCEAHAPVTTARLAVDGAALPVVPAIVRRIVVIGDTGCRLEGRAVQDCNDPVAWPFPTIAERAAARSPELVIHVGDYHYRASACPADRVGCAGSPYGDNWQTWQADFFEPATPLLAAAPWVMVRGNHEECRRGGQGWTRMLDPFSGPHDCVDQSAPYRVQAGGLDLLLFDSAVADDFKLEADKAASFTGQMASLLDSAPAHAWLLTHRPIWALAGGELTGMTVNLTEQAAIRGQISAGLEMVLSGHLHDFANYSFGPERPAQLIVGTGGDALLNLASTPIVGTAIDGIPIEKGFALKAFGYFMLDRIPGGWDGVLYGPADSVLARCALRGRDVDCR
jgi:hypothetical protein